MKTIRELAELCGVSKTTIERTIKELEINKQINGNKYLVSESDAIRICYEITHDSSVLQQNENRNATEQNEPEQFTSNATEPKQENATNQSNIIDPVQKLIETLEKEVEANRKVIDSLQEQNKILSQTIALQSSHILELNQRLLENKEKTRELVNDAVDPDENIVDPEPDTAQKIEEPQKKKGFFARIFGF